MTATPLCLYLDLEPGKVADLEVAARSAIQFSKALKEAAFILDPGVEIQVLLASGTPGSLSFDAIIKAVQDKARERPLLVGLMIFAAGWLANGTSDWTLGRTLDAIFGTEPQVIELSDEQVEQIASKVAEHLKNGVAKEHVQEMYREFGQDEAIRGVGITAAPGKKPKDIVPREQFPLRGGLVAALSPEIAVRQRTRTAPETVVIVSPVLVEGNRRWRVRSQEGEFGVTIKDHRFLDDLLAGNIVIPMQQGVEMDVVLETEEEWQDPVWVPISRAILHVIETRNPPNQRGLFSPR